MFIQFIAKDFKANMTMCFTMQPKKVLKKVLRNLAYLLCFVVVVSACQNFFRNTNTQQNVKTHCNIHLNVCHTP